MGDLPAFGEWQGRGSVAAGDRHGMCESGLTQTHRNMIEHSVTACVIASLHSFAFYVTFRFH
jgi:hypothetical protein